ncbi:N,N-dimethylformamidase beta subunit family domain-containing protein [Kitasatospora sp. NPDC087315]|uniref:N,N-dimethylformamidase beta subunit family domain-containing protein n=1 Tax=Kitasatospora sp. NPDC087315 TaxID=3364069 RepID=UPI00380A6CF0
MAYLNETDLGAQMSAIEETVAEGWGGRYAAYARATSCVQGGDLEFRFLDGPAGAPPERSVRIANVITGFTHAYQLSAAREHWTLKVPRSWPSGLYRAEFEPDGGEVWFAVRAARPGGHQAILVSLPFATWQAYNRVGDPGYGLYGTEQHDRAHRVSFDRPGGGPAPERWEEGLMRWLHRTGQTVDYCSNLDLHLVPGLLDHYRLLVCNGHDEYWTWVMRDTVEGFVAAGGNLAIFSGNTCWWQMRLEDEGRTMVCYRDAALDPVAATDPRRATTEWSSALVGRPENTLTGLSFRQGAGCWTDFDLMLDDSYRVAFGDHWALADTGLRDGDSFARGALGYETDAADLTWIDGVPRVTGRDGTPASFTVLATADLRHWRDFGQGGAATMGVFTLGRGSVFNAGTINWGRALDDPVVERITRNVLERFTAPPEPARWEALGPTPALRCLVGTGDRLFGLDGAGILHSREISCQNIPWSVISQGGEAFEALAITAPREAMGGQAQGLYALGADGSIRYRDATTEPRQWLLVGRAPAGADTLAACHEGLFVSCQGDLSYLPFRDLPASAELAKGWRLVGPAPRLASLSASIGRLFALTVDGRILSRLPALEPLPWQEHGLAGGCMALAAYSGMLLGVDPAARSGLLRRLITLPGPAAV